MSLHRSPGEILESPHAKTTTGHTKTLIQGPPVGKGGITPGQPNLWQAYDPPQGNLPNQGD